MRWLLVIFLTIRSISSFAQESGQRISLILKEGWLINYSDQPLYSVEITEPFYLYIGNLYPQQGKDISSIKTKFKVRFYIKALGGYKEMAKEFIPQIKYQEPKRPKIKVSITYKNCRLKVKVSSRKKLDYILIEIPPEYPVRISDERRRYVFSPVAVLGQNMIAGDYAEFRLYPLTEEKIYRVPVQISYIYQDKLYIELLFYSLKKEQLCQPPED